MSRTKGFTLIEVLIVLTLLGLTFTTLTLLLNRGVDSSLNITTHAESLRSSASLFWDLQRKVAGAKSIKVKDGDIFMVTTGGSLYPGVVKSAYLFRDGTLFYYEFPYPYGPIDEVEEDRLQAVGRFEEFYAAAVERRREFKRYEGLPRYVKVRINGREFLFETLVSDQQTPSGSRKP